MTGRLRTVAAVAALLTAVLAAAPGPVLAASPVSAAATGECTASTRIAEPVTALGELQSEAAWGLTRGAGVVVAVVDSGVAANPHLTGAIVGGVNLVPDGTDPTGSTDAYGHGTAIAGQIAARGIPGSGVEGLAPETRILPVRVFAGTSDQDVDAGFGPDVGRLAAGIRYAADHGAQIINVSMSTVGAHPGLAEAVAYASGQGSLVVSTAGNRDSTLSVEDAEDDGARYPAGFDGVLGVTATDTSGVVTDASIHGPHVRLAAPGQLVATSSAVGGDCVYATDAPATSYAAAYASASAALVAAAHPDESPAQWAYRLEATAVRTDPDRRDDVSGWGVVQPYDAIMLVPGSGLRGPASPFVDGEPVPPAAADGAAVRVTGDPGADVAAINIGMIMGIAGLVVLATLGALGVYVTRRVEPTAARAAPAGRGLFGDAPEA
ncbi:MULTISPECIES: S8 family serine peptidase [unclassified Microbacterium]|uniref:S8 family serine peptidase n=1 Tax=unclassified Microbacterium TaxID=2609290 RepID=UPI00214BCE13|nr:MULTISPECIES: S8 family serine peptidase [unclassified Microbacterium]MCR2784671.1 S8 family serine peptidase [Microbacterium sp. zg.B96]MDL5352878.1 S8 family serine peptidase [Microbacterium sp. zg-YB36]WIM16212.1 S8 family serine peptidase [Microbacterium sp. zg-B96]